MTSNISTVSCFVNVSDDSITRVGWIVDHPDDPNYDTVGNGYATAAIVSLLLIIGLPWNALIMWIIIRKRLYTQPTLMLLLNLTITNFLLGVIVMPINIISGFAGEFIFGPSDRIRCHVCQIGIAVIILPWVSAHTLALMSVDRFIYLKRPLKYSSIVTPKRMLLAIILTWFICVSISLPPLFGFGEINFSYTVTACVPFLVGETFLAPNYYYILFMTAEASIPLTTLFVMYVWILCITRKHLARQGERAIASQQKQNKSIRKQLRLVKVFGFLFTANLITWIPMVVLALTAATVFIFGLRNGELPTVLYTFAYLSYLSETVIHPIVEVTLVRDIRDAICRKFKFIAVKIHLYSDIQSSCAEDTTATKESHDAAEKDRQVAIKMHRSSPGNEADKLSEDLEAMT